MTKHDLSKIYFIEKEIKMWQNELDCLDAESLVKSPGFDGMPGGSFNPESKQERRAIDKLTMEQTIRKLYEELIKTRTELIQWISTIDNSYMRQLINYRCVNAMSWEEVTIKLGFGSDEVHRQAYKRFVDDYFPQN